MNPNAMEGQGPTLMYRFTVTEAATMDDIGYVIWLNRDERGKEEWNNEVESDRTVRRAHQAG